MTVGLLAIGFDCGTGIKGVGLPCLDKTGDESMSLILLSVGAEELKLKSRVGSSMSESGHDGGRHDTDNLDAIYMYRQ